LTVWRIIGAMIWSGIWMFHGATGGLQNGLYAP
jgi:hypothetical protein